VWRWWLPRAWSGVSEGWLIGQRAFLGVCGAARARLLDFTREHLSPWSRLGEPWPSGVTAMWAAVLLLAFLLIAY
jgi:hypothetical protein